jgi:hypothetical protein
LSVSIDLFADGNDFSYETIEKNRNIYYQKQTANQIINQVTEITSLITSALNIHLNIGQNLTMNTPSVFMSLETISIKSLENKQIQQVGDAHIRLPASFYTNLSSNTIISLRVCFSIGNNLTNCFSFSQQCNHWLHLAIQNLDQIQIYQHQSHFPCLINMVMKFLFEQIVHNQLK